MEPVEVVVQTGSNYSGFPNGNTYSGYNSWTNALPPETCSGLRALLYDMNYNGNFTAQLTGLTPGAVYEITLFFRAWDAPPSTQERRSIYQFYSVSSSYPDTSVIYASQPNSANAIVYRYMAPASGILKFAVTAVATSGNVASGCFGFSNEQLAAAAGTPPSSSSLALSGPLAISAALADNGSPTALTAAGTDPLTLSGPVSLTGNARFGVPLTLAPGASVTQAFNGPVSGNAAFTVNGNGRVILNTANPGLSSPVVVSTGILESAHSHSLGASAAPHVTVLAGGSLAIGQAVNNTIALTNTITIAGNGPDGLGTLRFDYDALQYNAFASVALADDAAVGGNGPSPLPYNGTRGRFDIRSGTLNLGAYGVQVGFDNWAASCGNLPLSGNTAIATDDNGYNRSQPAVGSGTLGSSRGILTISDNAFVRGRLYVGRDNGSAGAIYQTGGVFLNIGGAAADGRIGESGFGYYEISGGALTNKGYTQLSYNNTAYGTLRVKGEGRVVFNSGTAPAQGTGGDNSASYYGGNFATRAGYGHFFLSGNGTLDTGTAGINLCEWDGANSYNNGYGYLTLEEKATVSANTVIVANRNSTPLSAVTLKGGTLSTRYIQKGGNNAAGNTAQAAINFDGGTLSVCESGSAVRTGANNSPALLTVHSGGAVIDTPAVIGATLDLPLTAEQIGVNYIEVNSQGSGYIAPPAVLITGGGGTGAVAEAVLSDGKVTNIRVLSPGTGYTSTPSVSLNGGGPLSAATIRTSYIGVPSAIDGGLTKTGLGILTLNAANAYRGPTTVKGGTLMSSAAGSVPSGSDLVLDGGFLNLGGRTITNASVTLSSGGALVNGSVVTAALRKDGSGSADLAAGISLASSSLSANYGTPGLYEGRLTNISGNSNRADPNPCWTVQLTTRAVNGGYVSSGGTINNCLWPDGTCYVYTGYLWNRTGTNVVWTFGENFDDSVYLLIDGHAVLDNNSASTPTYRNIMLIPGPHAFEVRCGQGGSGVGGNWVQTSAYRLGFGVDFLGRAQNVADNYQPLTDPGDGSLLTVDLPACYTNAVVSSAPNQPDLPAEVVSNVGSLADGYALVYASDIPSSGGVINGSVAGTRYFTDNSRSDTNDFDRIAYYVELTSSTYGNQWVWVSFDAVTRDRTLIGYPWHDFTAGSNYCANIFQQKVSNMDVKSNVSTITNYVGSATGNIEFWPNDYGASDYLGLGASTTAYDFGDSMSSYPLSVPSHGSFQVHNWGDKTTLFAMDNWGKANSTISLGIGNNPVWSNNDPDYTFTYNAAQYTVRNFYVFVRPTTTAMDDALASVDLTVETGATLETALPSGWKLLRRGNDLLLFSESGILIKFR